MSEANITTVLEYLHDLGHITTKSDFARQYASEVAICCQLGLITTLNPTNGNYSNRWRLTPSGLDRLTNPEMYA